MSVLVFIFVPRRARGRMPDDIGADYLVERRVDILSMVLTLNSSIVVLVPVDLLLDGGLSESGVSVVVWAPVA